MTYFCIIINKYLKLSKILTYEKEIQEYQEEIDHLKSLDIIRYKNSYKQKEDILNEILEKIEYEYTYNINGNAYFADAEAQHALIRKLEVNLLD